MQDATAAAPEQAATPKTIRLVDQMRASQALYTAELDALTREHRGSLDLTQMLRLARRDELPADDLDIYAALPLLLHAETPDKMRRQCAERVLELLRAEPSAADDIRTDARALVADQQIDDEGQEPAEIDFDDVPF